MKFSRLLRNIIVASIPLTTSLLAAQTPTGKAEKRPSGFTIVNPTEINEIKIEVAETRVKLSGSREAVLELIVGLEEFLNTTCMGRLPYTLTYAGNPTDPKCIARMQRLLELNPDNPVGLCTRDGITAKSCIDAYLNQKIEPFYAQSSQEGLDPALKVGLSAADTERIEKIELSIAEIDSKYQNAQSDDEKRAFIQDAATLYDQALSVACKPTSLTLTPKEDEHSFNEPSEITQAREKLLQVPAAIRSDYQREMMGKAEKELASPNLSEERRQTLIALVKVIENPAVSSAQSLSGVTRTRIVLAKCFDLIKQATTATPDLPSVTCHRESWYSPQCIRAIGRWKASKQKGAKDAKSATPTPSSIIATF